MFCNALLSQTNALTFGLGNYPEEYLRYEKKDWENIKTVYEKILDSESLEKLYKDRKLIADAWFLFSRIADIDWKAEQKNKVVLYLHQFIIKMNESALTTEIEDKEFHFSHPASFPIAALWTISKLKPNEVCRSALEIFDATNNYNSNNNQIRNLAILYLRETYMNISDDECLLSIKVLNLDRKHKAAIDQLLLQNKASKIRQSKERWGAIWNELPIEKQKPITTKQNWSVFGQACMSMQRLNKNIDLYFLLNEAENINNPFAKRYFFLFSACFFTNRKLTLENNVEVQILERINIAVDEFYKQHGESDAIKNGDKDFLKNVHKIMNNHASKK